MKDNKKQRTTSSIENEENKTAFEKFEDELKGTIFNVLYVLLKDDETSHWKHIILILFDYIQIYYFSFADNVYNSNTTNIVNYS
jgi:hypothetical protein